jgi:hypothetical protein
MDITSFNRVVKFIIQTKATNSFYMPNTETITNMRVYNTTRASRARTLAAQLVNTELVSMLRKCSKLVQLDTCIDDVQCCISKSKLRRSSGKVLLLHYNNGLYMYAIHQRFVNQVNKFYNIVHFDDEIYKSFRNWFLKKSTTLSVITNDNIEEYVSSFSKYSGSSNVNFLYMKFIKNCDL